MEIYGDFLIWKYSLNSRKISFRFVDLLQELQTSPLLETWSVSCLSGGNGLQHNTANKLLTSGKITQRGKLGSYKNSP